MTTPPVTIRQMQASHIGEVVAIHQQSFPATRSTRLGPLFLNKMYHWFLAYHPELAFVAETDGRVVGFLTGAIGGSSRRIFHHAFWEIVFGFIRRPKLLFQADMFEMWHSHIRGLAPRYGLATSRATKSSTSLRATLPSVAVSSVARGMGVGKALVDAFETAAKDQGATVLGLGVDLDNGPARRLYESCGWVLAWEDPANNSAGYAKEIHKEPVDTLLPTDSPSCGDRPHGDLTSDVGSGGARKACGH